MTLDLRDATPEDEAAWRALWAGYLDFYEVTLTPDITARTWARLMDPGAPMKARLACRNGRVLGFAVYLHHPSSWIMGEDCYLEDLYVDPAARGHGVGRALIADLALLARARGWHWLYWHTKETNARARALYDSFVPADGHIRYRMALSP